MQDWVFRLGLHTNIMNSSVHHGCRWQKNNWKIDGSNPTNIIFKINHVAQNLYGFEYHKSFSLKLLKFMQSGGLLRTCSFIWLWSSVKARGHTSWELMTCIPREFSLLKSAVHFELLVLLFLLLAQFLLYKQLWSLKLYILWRFLLFVCLILDSGSFSSWKVLCTLSCMCCCSCCLLNSYFF